MTALALEQGPVDAIICATDRLAFGAYRVLQARGLSIPKDVSVAAFGGYDESELLTPRLTTIKVGSYAVGELGAGAAPMSLPRHAGGPTELRSVSTIADGIAV